MRKTTPLLIFFLLTLSVSGSPLVWQRTLVEPRAEPGQETIEFGFPFENRGDRPVTILSVESSCGCTAAALEKRTYQPGEGGEIRATFTPGARVGLQEKSIRVRTDASPESVELRMRVEIPVVFEVTPRVVYWNKGEKPEPKRVEVRLNPSARLVVAKVAADAPGWQVAWSRIEDSNRYEVTVRPDSTDQMAKANLHIATKYPEEADKSAPSYTVFAHVFPQ